MLIFYRLISSRRESISEIGECRKLNCTSRKDSVDISNIASPEGQQSLLIVDSFD